MLPTPAFREPEFEERLREQVDVDKLIEADQRAVKEQANARIPFEPKNLMEKDQKMITKLNQLSAAIKVDEPPLFGLDVNEEYIIDEGLRDALPTEKRILSDEVFKVLHFNNEDPNTYNVSFWSEYFQMDAAAIRNIFNYLAYPVIDQKTKKVVDILYFQDTEL